MSQIIPQFIIVLNDQQALQVLVVLLFRLFISHIPIILLTALNDEKNILEGLKIGADEYIVKPFNIGILKATIANLLTNRALLKSKYANLEVSEEEEVSPNCATDLDWKFIATVKKSVEENIDNPAAPIFSPSRIFFSSFSAVSRMMGMCEVSISFLMAAHNSSPRISGIMISEIISSGIQEEC